MNNYNILNEKSLSNIDGGKSWKYYLACGSGIAAGAFLGNGLTPGIGTVGGAMTGATTFC